MSTGWSWWVMFLVVLNLGITFLLFLWAPRAKVPTLPDGTTGHVWAHGVIREGMHRLPGWWIVLSFLMFFSAFVYLALYPGFGNHKGTLKWTSHGELAADTAANAAKLGPLMQRFGTLGLAEVAQDPQARQIGERLFVDNCAACHGRHALGNVLLGAPNLADADWIYGGTDKDIATSIHDGRSGVMPPWNALGEPTVKNLAQYVLGLSGAPHDATAAAAGEAVFKTTCIACHGPDGKGNPVIGAPNLTDAAWLYGGTLADVEASIRNGRQGHMPKWSPRLSDEQIHVVAAYVHYLSQRGDAAAH